MDEEVINYHIITRSKRKKRRKISNNKLKKNKSSDSDSDSNSDSDSDSNSSSSCEDITSVSDTESLSPCNSQEVIHDSKLPVLHKRKITNFINMSKDYLFFKTLNEENKNYIEKEQEQINNLANLSVPPKYKILLSKDLDVNIKSMALQKMSTLDKLNNDSSEYYKLKNWFSGLLNIPFGTHINMPVTKSDGKLKINEYLYNVQEKLNETVYGMEDPKSEILQYITQCITNPNTSGNILAIEGPPGTGKTSLIKDGVCNALNRPFGFIALGGATDSAFLEGHGYTYEGSSYGKIVSILMKTKCMNPIIYFDELDKVSTTSKGQEIIGILMHLIDSSQNESFHDKYYSDIDFDLSKALFIFSFNDREQIDPILRDRMKIIKINGYSDNEKKIIATNYLLPSIHINIGLSEDNVIWEQSAIDKIITKTTKIKGVREIKRHLTTILQKINTLQYSTNEKYKLQLPYYIKDITFPLKITDEIVDILIKNNKEQNTSHEFMYT
jgi:ATP-dependent Lon protease